MIYLPRLVPVRVLEIEGGMDRLKSAVENLEPPHCPNCHVAMRWFRSELVLDAQQSIVAHLLICPNCKRAHRIDTEFTPISVPPDRRAAPLFRVVRGARR